LYELRIEESEFWMVRGMDTPKSVIDELRRENVELRAQLAAALDDNRQLRERLDQAEREAARQAAPFRRRESKKIPDGAKKRPGRPKGHKGEYRRVPAQIDDHAEAPLNACPKCGGPVTAVVPVEQFIEGAIQKCG
jgi:hypothetical protein